MTRSMKTKPNSTIYRDSVQGIRRRQTATSWREGAGPLGLPLPTGIETTTGTVALVNGEVNDDLGGWVHHQKLSSTNHRQKGRGRKIAS